MNQSPDPRPSRRLDEISEYYFSRALKEIADMNARGLDVINLGIGSPDMPPPGDAIDALCRAARMPDAHGYQPYSGIPELRQAFARWYARHYRVDLDPAREILPLAGSKEGILHVSLAFLDPWDQALVPDPGYPAYGPATRLAGGVPVTYDLTPRHHWQPDWDALERADLSLVKLMWANYPHMPTGAPATTALLERLVDFGRRHSIIICHDNPYSFILNDHPASILEIPAAREIAIEMNSLSKSHDMPGWRVAMLASNPRFVKWILEVKSNIDSGQFRPVMLAAAQALDAPDAWYRENNRLLAERRQVAASIMQAIQATCRYPQSGFFLWGSLPGDDRQLVDARLSHARVCITPGFIFGNNGRGHVRVSLCCSTGRLREALDRVTRYM